MTSRILQARQTAGLTRQEVSDGMGIPYSTLTKWERGESRPPVYVEQGVLSWITQQRPQLEEWAELRDIRTGEVLAWPGTGSAYVSWQELDVWIAKLECIGAHSSMVYRAASGEAVIYVSDDLGHEGWLVAERTPDKLCTSSSEASKAYFGMVY